MFKKEISLGILLIFLDSDGLLRREYLIDMESSSEKLFFLFPLFLVIEKNRFNFYFEKF